jgi:MFS family permease
VGRRISHDGRHAAHAVARRRNRFGHADPQARDPAADRAAAALPASRTWRPLEVHSEHRRAALRSGGLRTLVLVLALVGVLLGAVEVAIPAVARAADAQGATGPLLALWGLGSMIGGFAAARAGGLHGRRVLGVLLVALAAGHLLPAAGGGLVLLGALLVLAGLPLAPAFAAIYALVDEVAVPGTVTEAFAWLTTAIAVGIAGGAAAGGALADVSPTATFAFAAAAGGAAAAVALAWAGRRVVAPAAVAHATAGSTSRA